MRSFPAYVFGGLGAVLLLSGAWLLITGRNFPGVLGRGLTDGDRVRIQRAPAQYWRVGGALALIAGSLAFAVSTIYATNPTPSRSSLILLSAVVAVFFLLFTPLLAWFIVLSAKYHLFRWDKP